MRIKLGTFREFCLSTSEPSQSGRFMTLGFAPEVLLESKSGALRYRMKVNHEKNLLDH